MAATYCTYNLLPWKRKKRINFCLTGHGGGVLYFSLFSFKQKNSLSVYDRSRVFFQLKKKRNTILLRGKKGVQNVALPNYIGNGCKSHCITFPPTNLNKLPPYVRKKKFDWNFPYHRFNDLSETFNVMHPIKNWRWYRSVGTVSFVIISTKGIYTLLLLIAKGELFLQPIKNMSEHRDRFSLFFPKFGRVSVVVLLNLSTS